MRQLVALVLGFLDLVGLVPRGVLGCKHLLEEPRGALQLVGQRLEVGIELLFSGNQSELHGARIVADRSRHLVTAVLHVGPPGVRFA